MNELDQRDLESLMAHERPHSVSISMPVRLGGPDTKQNSILLRKMLDEAEWALRAEKRSGPQAREHLAAARELLTDTSIWRSEARGAAVFIANGRARLYGVPIVLPQCVHVGPRFHTRHLLPIFVGDGRYYILALSRESVRLYEASRWTIDELELPRATPRSFAELEPYIDTERQLQWHTRAQPTGEARMRAAMFHGSGVGTDEQWEKRQTADYCHMVAEGVQRVLNRKPGGAPLILAAAEPTASIYRRANHNRHLLDEVVHGNPEGLSPDELRRQAWPLVEPRVREAVREEIARYEEARGAAHASSDLRQVLAAAHNGQIRTLFVAIDGASGNGHCWGRFDPARREMEIHPEPWPGDDDLLDQAASRAFLSGGGVFLLPREQMPEGALAAATFRYVPVV